MRLHLCVYMHTYMYNTFITIIKREQRDIFMIFVSSSFLLSAPRYHPEFSPRRRIFSLEFFSDAFYFIVDEIRGRRLVASHNSAIKIPPPRISSTLCRWFVRGQICFLRITFSPARLSLSFYLKIISRDKKTTRCVLSQLVASKCRIATRPPLSLGIETYRE